MYKCNVCVVVLVGIPGSGKTTFCQSLPSRMNELGLHIVCYDDLCRDHSGASRKSVFESARSLISALTLDRGNNHVVIIDDNMYYKSMRSVYLNLCKELNIGFLQAMFDVPLNVCIVRNNSRISGKVPEAIIVKMHGKLEKPAEDSYIVNATDLDGFRSRCVAALMDPKRFIHRREKVALPLSDLQRVDLILRQIVSERVQGDRRNAGLYGRAKQAVVKRFKNGDFTSDDDDYLRESLLAQFDRECCCNNESL